MKIIGKAEGGAFIVTLTQHELVLISGQKAYLSDDDAKRVFAVGNEVKVAEALMTFNSVTSQPEQLTGMAQRLRAAAETLDSMNEKFNTIIAKPVKEPKKTR